MINWFNIFCGYWNLCRKLEHLFINIYVHFLNKNEMMLKVMKNGLFCCWKKSVQRQRDEKPKSKRAISLFFAHLFFFSFVFFSKEMKSVQMQ